MASSYLADGDFFLSENDPVNAIGAFSYAHGWLDAASVLGLVGCTPATARWLFLTLSIPEEKTPFLQEKVSRYGKILGSALENVSPAPEPHTFMEDAAGRFILAAIVLKRYGELFSSSGMSPNALGAYSYGHAWLDAGIRAGLIRVSGQGDLFAV